MKYIICIVVIACIGFNAVRAQSTYQEITLVDLMKKKKSGDQDMVIVDVRSRGEYADTGRNKSGNIGRIDGAINITLQDLQSSPDAVKQLDAYRDKEIYLICSHSYRSRSASAILLRNGFTHVNNVQGGMTEWYRRYSELAGYRDQLMDKDIRYKNLSPEELLSDLSHGKEILLLGIRNKPRAWWDSAAITFYSFYPALKNTVYYEYADSLKVLEAVQSKPGRPVVLFNMVNNGAAELADWLAGKGISNVSFLVGNVNLLYEYALNKNKKEELNLFRSQSSIRFYTPETFCTGGNGQWIDIRHDSLFNKVNKGVKHDYRHLKNALNFYSGKSALEFEKTFPDKSKTYVFINSSGGTGIDLANSLASAGYGIIWLIGGYDRWEWYMNNVEGFKCNDRLE